MKKEDRIKDIDLRPPSDLRQGQALFNTPEYQMPHSAEQQFNAYASAKLNINRYENSIIDSNLRS